MSAELLNDSEAVVTEIPPQPIPDEDTFGFWEAIEGGRLAICRCQNADCGRWQQPPLERCPTCWSETAYEDVAGTGVVHAFIVVHQPAIPGFRDKLPYAVGLIELDEQSNLRLPGEIIGIDPADVHVGLVVRAEIRDLPGGTHKVAVFRPS